MPADENEAPERGSTAAEQKAFTAEKNTSLVRLAVIVFGVIVYWSAYYPKGVPWLAAVVSVVALGYALYDVLAEPYRRFPILVTSLWTAITDGVLITVWLHATGDVESPFYLLWFLSLVAVTFRYDWRATAAAACLYVVAYTGLVAATGGLPSHAFDMAVRNGYLLLLGALGSLLARESTRVFEERFHLGEQVRRAQALQDESDLSRLREMDRFKGEFINAPAHELNTPLTPLKLQLRVLKQRMGAAPEADRAMIEVLERNLNRLAELVEEMLDVARLQSGRLRMNLVPCDMDRLVRDTVDTFQEMAKQRGIRMAVASEGAITTIADGNRVTQVLVNLVSNALKFTPKGGSIDVELRSEPGAVAVHVRDSGVGLSPEQIDGLFQPFVQLHRDQVTATGTGLGLYISRGIAQRHGGTLICTSEGVGRGAVFTMRLPVGGVQGAE